MLVAVHRSDLTDRLSVQFHVENFTVVLAKQVPASRSEAVQLAKDFLRVFGFRGEVRWQIGKASAITDSPTV
jgi:hypothetical protein